MSTSSRRNGGRTFRPRLEVLESRTLLSFAGCIVDRLTDTGAGSGLMGDLRYCITNVTDGDDIIFAVQGTINLTGALPDLTHSISIEGPGASSLTVQRDTGGDYRILTVARGATVVLSGLTIANGSVPETLGGGILSEGSLTISNSTVRGNLAFTGGGILNEGSLIISNSTIANNTVNFEYGEVRGGGIYNAGTLAITNSTIASNEAAGTDPGVEQGGGIYNAGTLTVNNSTISGNAAYSVFASGAADGGGIYNTSTLNMRNTVLARNYAGRYGPDLFGSLASSGYNVIGNTQGGSGFDPTDLLNTDPLLGPLQNNGGPTLTMALQRGSPAIDAGDNTGAPDWDQRGEGFPRIVNDIIDIGAYEVQQGECDGSAPHGLRDQLKRYIGMAFMPHATPQSEFTSIHLTADVQMNPVPLKAQDVGATRTQSETLPISQPTATLHLAQDSLFMELEFGFPGIENPSQQN